jgi:hypothetical protein
MATIIRVAGADFSANPVGFIPPVADGLEGWFYLGGDLEKSVRNLAPGRSNALVAGAPTVETSHLRCTAGAYLQTSIVDEGDFTLLTVSKLPAEFDLGANFAWPISSFSSGPGIFYRAVGANPSAGLAIEAPTDVGGVSTYTQAFGPTDVTASAWTFWGGKFQTGVGFNNYDKTAGTSAAGANANNRFPQPGNPYRIGASTAGSSQPIDVAFAAIFSRALSVDEIEAVYQAVKAYMTRRHTITV